MKHTSTAQTKLPEQKYLSLLSAAQRSCCGYQVVSRFTFLLCRVILALIVSRSGQKLQLNECNVNEMLLMLLQLFQFELDLGLIESKPGTTRGQQSCMWPLSMRIM